MPVSSEALSPAEVQTLEHYEHIIAQGIKTFVEVGQALLAIRDQRLYRQSLPTFEDYLRQRWDLSSRAYPRMMTRQWSSRTCLPIGDIVPMNEAQARPLTISHPSSNRRCGGKRSRRRQRGRSPRSMCRQTVKRVKAGTPTAPKAPKLFDVQSIQTQIKALYMTWLKHCEDATALKTAHAFLNLLSDLAVGREIQLHPSR